MVGLTGALIGSAVIGGATSIIGGNKASKAQRRAAEQSIAEQRRQYDTTRADYAPWRQRGTQALDMMARAYGLGGQTPDMSAFTASPGYQFRQQEGIRAAERSAAARGRLGSGATMTRIQERAEGLAASEFGDWWNRMAGISGVGQAATGSTAQAGMNMANNISNAYQNAGNARASAYANTAGAVNSGINNVLSAYLFNQGWGAAGG